MKGFKNSTKTQYSSGGQCYAKGGVVKGAAKEASVLREHMGKPKPVKKSLGGIIKKISPLAALATGDDSGIGGALKALSPAAALLMKKKKNPVEEVSVAQAALQPQAQGYKRGGKVHVRGGLSFGSKPLIGK